MPSISCQHARSACAGLRDRIAATISETPRRVLLKDPGIDT
jgi:hypothetical protein